MSQYEFVISAKDKTAQAFSSINKNMGSMAKQATTAAAAVAGVTATFAALMTRAGNNARELEAQARMAGLNVEQFQELSFAFEQFNISQEKFADISKDVQDKLGDFLATGAGPFKDFFEQVAPKVGLTADALRDLSAPDVLIAVKKAMDDANVSAKEQVFYMEAIANDASLLIEPLQNNGKAIKDYAEQFKSLNATMSETEVEKLKQVAEQMDRLQKAAEGIGNKIAANFAEPLADILEVMEQGLPEHLMRAESAFKGMAIGIFEVAAASAQMARWNPYAMFVSGKNRDELEAQADSFSGFAQQLRDEVTELNGKLNELEMPNFGQTNDIFAGLEDPFNIENAVTNQPLEPVKEAAENVKSVFLEALSLSDEAAALTDTFNFKETMEVGAEDFWGTFEQRGFEAYSTMSEANTSFWDQWLESAQATMMNYDELSRMTIENFSTRMGSALESMIFDSQSLGDAMSNMLEGVARSTVNAIGQMIGQWLAYKAVQMLVGSSTAMAGAGGLAANAQAASMQAGLNAFASTAAIPVVGPAMAPGAMQAALAVTQPMAFAIKGLAAAGAAASFEGGGYTWDGARVGGMDGKGGKLAMLHPREKITDLTKEKMEPQSRQPTSVVINMPNAQYVDAKFFEKNGAAIKKAVFGPRAYRR